QREQPLEPSAVGWHQQTGSIEPRLYERSFLVRARLAALAAVIRAHAAGADAAEGQIVDAEVHHVVVHDRPTGGGAREHLAHARRILVEIVKRKRARAL